MTEEFANTWLEKYGEACFEQYAKLIYIAVSKESPDIDKDDYYIEIGIKGENIESWLETDCVKIHSNINFKPIKDQMIKRKNYLESVNVNVSTIIDKIESFKSINTRDNSKIVLVPIATEKVFLQSDDSPNTQRYDFVTGGTSISLSDRDGVSGTAGAFFKIKNSADCFMISNYHVVGNGGRRIAVTHPSIMDANNNGLLPLDNPIGKVFWKCNKNMDVAIVKIDYPVANCYTRCEKINFSGGIGFPKNGQKVMKCGRTTGLKEGIILSTNCYVNVTDSKENNTLFKNQIMTTKMSDHGDSGAVLVNNEKKVVGLLFASSEEKTFHNIFHNIFEKFNTQCLPNNKFEKFI